MKSLSKLIVFTAVLLFSALHLMVQAKDHTPDIDAHGGSHKGLLISSSDTQNEVLTFGFILSFMNVEDDAKPEHLPEDHLDFDFYKTVILSLIHNEDREYKKLQNPLLSVDFEPLKFYDIYCNWQIDFCQSAS